MMAEQWIFEALASAASWLMFQRGRWAILRAAITSL